MTNKERDEILLELVKGVNSLQVTVNDIRAEMKNFVTKEEFESRISKLATKEEISKLATKEELKELKDEMIKKIDESKNEIRAEVVEAIKEASHISYDRYIELKNRIAVNEKDIKEIKLAIAN